jgi:GR25 family glycosyltransferase involved in LPS biosynthesis
MSPLPTSSPGIFGALVAAGLEVEEATLAEKRGEKRRLTETVGRVARPLRQRTSLTCERQTKPPASVLCSLRSIVVNLERRPDRMEGCAARLRARCPGLHFERFIATDGRSTPIGSDEVAHSWHTARNVVYQKHRSIRKGWDDLHTYHERTLPLSGGERGCSSSHLRAWRYCLEQAGESGNSPLLVLEDDAAPTEEFAASLERVWRDVPSDCGVLYLGYSQAADWRREVSPNLVEAEYVWTTVAYVIWPSAARFLLSQLPVNEPVDNWMAGFSAAGDVKAYCVRPKIVLQADAWNVNSDVAHSDEHYWGPCSDIRHSDELYWGTEELRARDRQPGGAMVGAALLGDDADDSESSCED